MAYTINRSLLYSETGNCACAGATRVRIIPTADIAWATINAAIGTYYNLATGLFTGTSLPINTGRSWIDLASTNIGKLTFGTKKLSRFKYEHYIKGDFIFDCNLMIVMDALNAECGFVALIDRCDGTQMIIGMEYNPRTSLMTKSVLRSPLTFTQLDMDGGTIDGGDSSFMMPFEMKGLFYSLPKCTASSQNAVAYAA